MLSFILNKLKPDPNKWSTRDQLRAAIQGWGLFEVDGVMELNAVDARHDIYAWLQVATAMHEKEPLATKAMKILEASNPEEYQGIMSYYALKRDKAA